MHRRTLVTSVAIAVSSTLAGCTTLNPFSGTGGETSGPIASLKMEAMNDTELVTKGLYTGGIDTGPKDELFGRILAGGATVRRLRPPFPADEHLLYNDTVYQLSYNVVNRTPATAYSVRVDIAKEPASEAKTIWFADLPAVDREMFERNGLADGQTIGVGTRFLYTNAEREQSVLVPESKYTNIVWDDGSRAKWVVKSATEQTLQTYRYSAERINTASEYGRRLRNQVAFDLSGVSDAEQDIIKTAITEDQYLVTSDESPSSALVSLAERFRTQDQAHRLNEAGANDLNGSYIVQYENTTYWTTLTVASSAFPTETTG